MGEGDYAEVYLVKKVGGSDDGKLYAAKINNEENNTEVKVLKELLDQPYFIQYRYNFDNTIIMDYTTNGTLKESAI